MRSWTRTARNVALAAVAGVGLALGGFAIASAASGGRGSGSGANDSAPPGPGWAGFGPIAGPGGVDTVTALGTNSFTVTTTGGPGFPNTSAGAGSNSGSGSSSAPTSFTVDTDSSTTYSETGTPNKPNGVSVGDHVVIRYVRPAPPSSSAGSSTTSGTSGSPAPSASTPRTAASVEIVLTELAGKVVSTGSGQLVIEDAQGFYRTVHTSGVQYFQGSASIDSSKVTTGGEVSCYGSVDSGHTSLDARFVDLEPDRVSGTVTSVSTAANQIVVNTGSSTVTVDVSASTTFSSPGTTGSFGAVASGDRITAVGTESGSVLQATQVSYSSSSSTAPGGRGFPGGGGSFGRGRGFGGGGGFGGLDRGPGAGGPGGSSATSGTPGLTPA